MEFRELSDEEWEVIRPLLPLGLVLEDLGLMIGLL
jgi:transposase